MDELDEFEIVEASSVAVRTEHVDNVAAGNHQEWMLSYENVVDMFEIREYSTVDGTQAERYYQEYPEHFIEDIMRLMRGKRVEAVNFSAVTIDPETDEQTTVQLRIDLENIALESLVDEMRNSVAPMYMNKEGYGSDSVRGKRVVWNLQWFKTISRCETSGNVTAIVGNQTMFPGYVTKVINTYDHQVVYSAADCLLVCLNEALGVMLNPMQVRRQIKSLGREFEEINIYTDLQAIGTIYRCNIAIHDIGENKKLVSSKNPQYSTVKLVKLGRVVGIIERASTVQIVDKLSAQGVHAYYDYETISKSDNTDSYAFSMIWTDDSQLFLMHDDPNVLSESIRQSIVGKMLSLPESVATVYLHAWNGSRFDHGLLLRLCDNKSFKLKHITRNSSNEILSALVSCAAKNIVLRDPCKMFPGTLSEVAQVFGLEIGKLELSHDAIEDAYIRGHLREYLREHKQQIEQYALRDVQLLRIVTERIMQMYRDSNIIYNACYTRSMATTKLWRANLSKDNKEKLSTVQFNYNECLQFSTGEVDIEKIRECAIGGRVQAMRGEYQHVTLLDFVSMYPTVAAQEKYPAGAYEQTTTYEPGKLGLYFVNISKQTHPHVIPFRATKHDTYDWTYSQPMLNKLVTSIDVECMLESDAEFEIVCGIVWDETANYFEGHMLELMSKREECKRCGNVAMSEHYKHMCNGLTGAIFQQLRREYIKIFSNTKDALEYVKMHSKYVKLSYEESYSDGRVILYFIPLRLTDAHDIKIQRELCQGALGSKPILLTMFIYAYARAKLWRMWRYIEMSNIGIVVYCDTDSLSVAARVSEGGAYVDVAATLSEYIGTSFGKLKPEIVDADMIVIQPKLYAMRNNQEEKVRAKGMDKKGKLQLVHRLDTGKIKMLRELNWDGVRKLNETLTDSDTVQLTYATIRHLLLDYVLVSSFWYYEKTTGAPMKKYRIRIAALNQT